MEEITIIYLAGLLFNVGVLIHIIHENKDL